MKLILATILAMVVGAFAKQELSEREKQIMLGLNRLPTGKMVPRVLANQAEFDICEECESAVEGMKEILNNPNDEDQVKQILMDICPYVPMFMTQAKCEKLVTSNIKGIVKKLLEMMDNSRDVCGTFYLCDAQDGPSFFHRAGFRFLQSRLYKIKTGATGISISCDTCKGVVQELENLLNSQVSQDELKAMLRKACGKLPLFKVECEGLVDLTFSELLKLVEQHVLSPTQVCGEVHLCASATPTFMNRVMSSETYPHIAALPEHLGLKTPSPAGCIACETIFATAVSALGVSITETAIADEVINILQAILPTEIGKQAKSFVGLYGPTALTMSLRQANVTELCILLTACSKNNPFMSTKRENLALSSNFFTCEACKGATDLIATELKGSALQQEIVQLLNTEICQRLPPASRLSCFTGLQANAPAYIYQLGAILNSASVCKSMSLC
jgi:hypothetical protein